MINSVRKAMAILAILSKNNGNPVTLMEISQKVSCPKSTCAHLLKTLCFDGYAKQISHKSGYVLGPATYYLTREGRYENNLIVLIRPIMKWLNEKTNATVIFSTIQGNQKYIIDYLNGDQNLLGKHEFIKKDDVYRTATGRAILAQMNRDELKEFWDSNGPPAHNDWAEVKSYEDLCKVLGDIRKQTIIKTKESSQDGITTKGFAYPIFKRIQCIGAIGIAWVDKYDEEKSLIFEEKFCRLLLKAVKEIQHRISYEDN